MTLKDAAGTAITNELWAAAGTNLTAEATAAEGWLFAGWYTVDAASSTRQGGEQGSVIGRGGDAVSTTEVLPFAVDAPVFLEALFTQKVFTVTFDLGGHGTRSGGGELLQPVVYGESAIAPTVSPAAGYAFKGWDRSFDGVTKAITVKAVYETIVYTITYVETKDVENANPTSYTVEDSVTFAALGDTAGWKFVGWSVDGLAKGSTGNRTVTALWEQIAVVDHTEIAETTVDATVANVYDGFLYDGDTPAGTIQVKLAKANKKTGLAKLTATITPAGGKKTTASGNFDPAAESFVAKAKDGTALELVIGANGLYGTFGKYAIDGARNLYSSKTTDDKQTVADADQWIGSYAIVWEESGEDAAGTPRLQGWNILMVSIAKKGKVKVSGTLADGTKVSASAQMIVGAERCCIPVVYSKKTVLLNFCIWLGRGEDAASTGEGAPVDAASRRVEIVGLDGAIFGKAGNLAGTSAFSLDDVASLVSGLSSSTTTVLSDYLPDGAEIAPAGTKWIVMPDENGKAMKAGKLVWDKKAGEINETKSKIEGYNVSGLKLTFTAKTGAFKGSFKVYTVVKGALKNTTVNVTGVVIDGVGYGTATIKKVGSFAVRIE